MLMAADQRRKRSNGVAVVGNSSRENFRAKKKQPVSLENGFKVKPHISLHWDASRRRVVPKKEQIGLSSRNLRPFVDSLPHGHHILADTFDVPLELFKLRNLQEVLSYEAWQSYLSEGERKFLMQFLPRELDASQVVKQLLGGDDFYFGNPLLKWEASLLSGAEHPDAVVHHEQSLKTDKRAYYLQLQKYHTDMIGSLSKLKERWEACKDPEKEFNQRILSKSRKDAEEKFSTSADGSGLEIGDESFAATTESSSLGAEERTSNSDGQHPSVIKSGELQKRVNKKRTMKDRPGNRSIPSDDVLNGEEQRQKSVKLKKRNILYSDGTKYMSYIKISKKQHEFAKSMEQSGASIQSRSLGNLDNLEIQPYEVFVEEQQKKLRDHWVRLANNDLPATYKIWKDGHLQRQQMMRSLEQDLKEKLGSLMEDEEEGIAQTILQPQEGDEEMDRISIMEEEKESSSCSSQSQQKITSAEYASSAEDDEESVPGFHHDDEDNEVMDRHLTKEKDHNECVPLQNMEVTVSMDPSTMDGDDKFVPSHQLTPNQVPSLSVGHNFNHLNLEPENNQVSVKADDVTHQGVSTYSGDLNSAGLMDIHQPPPLSRSNDMWQPVSMEPTYYDSSAGCQYDSAAGEMPLVHPPVNGEQRQQHWMHKNLLHHEQQPSEDSFNNSYPRRDQNELLHSIFNNTEQKSAGLNFQPTSNMFPRHFQDPVRLPPLPLQQNMSGNIIPNGGRFLMPRQEQHLLPVGMQDWPPAPSPIHVPSTLQPPLPGAELSNSQNWFGAAASQQSIGSGINLDQSLYSVLPQLPSRPSYDSLSCSEQQFIPSRSYGIMGGGIGIPLPQTAPTTTLDYLNRRDSVMSEDSSWMGLPHQNPGMNDNPMGKPFLGSWNQ